MKYKVKAIICTLFLLLDIYGCKTDKYYEKECKVPDFLTGNKKVVLNSDIDNIPGSDSLGREVYPSPFSWLPFERDTLYNLILFNNILPAGMDCQIQISSDRRIRVISITRIFNVKSLKEAEDFYRYFLKNISECYSVQVSSTIDTIVNAPERPDYVNFEGKMFIPNSGYCEVSINTSVEKLTYKPHSANLFINFESYKERNFE